jgi:hypothetical protein
MIEQKWHERNLAAKRRLSVLFEDFTCAVVE